MRPAQDGGGRGRALAAPCWVGDREEAFSLTLDFYGPVLFATEKKEKSDRGILVHGPSRGRPPQPLAPAGVWQAGTVPLSVPPGTWHRSCMAGDPDSRHASRPRLVSTTCGMCCDPAHFTGGETEAQGG